MTTLRNLDNFGDIAAEDEPVIEYFLTTPAVEQILSGKTLLVLGRKGSGKTALVKHFTQVLSEDHGSPLSLRNYPWLAHGELIDKGASPSEAYVASWRLLIAIRMASHVVRKGNGKHYTDGIAALTKFLQKNFDSIDPDTRSIVQQEKIRVEGLSLGPQISGVALGFINLRRGKENTVLGAELNALTNSILNDVSNAISELRIERLYLHFDELDQGLDKVTDERANMLIGLILAAREISRSTELRANICPIVYLRTDIWEQIGFSDKNKITRGAAISLTWGADALRDLIDVRLQKKLGPNVSWENIADAAKMRGSQAKLDHIFARTFMRPRDVIQFLNEALHLAKGRPDEPLVLTNEDINGCRASYSDYLKEELDDEIAPHWDSWDDALAVCSKTETLTFDRVSFVSNYGKMKSSKNKMSAEEALENLYRFSVIGYQTRMGTGGSGWAFRYLNPNAKWDPSVSKLKVHIGLKEFARLKEERADSKQQP
ncbi:P-loop ATPase, Sll1717 family [Jannaschia sp. 2305UL9-9]|uniref:P-loop ATPase, Sll1717 family n=1 Tax=Jannaschia sp. 2305UL9-9 TaxID=3121638 RepID=UPI00352849F2